MIKYNHYIYNQYIYILIFIYKYRNIIILGLPLVAQLVKNLPAMQKTPV